MMPLRSLVRRFCFVTLAAVLATLPASLASSATGPSEVFKATLPNGLRVVILRNTIAPVVSTEMTYLVGSRDDPAGVPGMAHAQEHMMFRGTPNLSTSELGTVATALGGAFNAATSDLTTQYQFTVPAADLDAVLRIESDRMRSVLDAQSQWRIERGAIEQEVLRDESEPGSDFFSTVHQLAFAGTPYGHKGVGTRAAFDRLTGPQIKAFYDRWYAPNNAVFVIAGDVDPEQTLAAVRAHFASIPRRAVPAHRAAHLAPLGHVVLARRTTLVYPLAVVAFRFPGIDSPDFLASYVLQGILGSPRGPMQGLIDTGESLGGGWESEPYVPEAQLAYASAALRPGGDPAAAAQHIERLLGDFAAHGVSNELFLSTQRRLIADQEVSRNSIEALASDWATTIAVDGEPSIAREQQLIANVTLAEVNRVAKRYLDAGHAIVGALTPSASASQNAAAAPAQLASEKPLDVGSQTTTLPSWASDLVRHIDVPAQTRAPVQTKLANGITLIVQPETISDSVFVYGRVKTNLALEEPDGKEGVAAILATMFEYGTKNHDRPSFQRLQDDADTELSAGSGFGLQTTSRTFDRAIALLAENELEPRFDQTTFGFAQRRASDELASALGSSATLARRRTNEYFLPPGDPELREPTVNGMHALTDRKSVV
jgi:zinc protease